MSEDVKPRQFKLEWKYFQGCNIWHVEGDGSYEQYEKIKVVELEPTLQLMKEMSDALEFYSNKTKLDCGEMASVKLEKYRKFLEGIK